MARQPRQDIVNMMDRVTALTTCFANINAPGRGNVIAAAHALQYLKSLPDGGSNRKVADQIGVSAEAVRQYLSVLELPLHIRDVIESGKMGLDKARLLAMLQRSRPDVIDGMANVIQGVPSGDARNIVEYLVRVPDSSVEDAVEAINDAKPVITYQHFVSGTLDETSYNKLAKKAGERGMSVNGLATSIVTSWLMEHPIEREKV